MKSLLRLVRHKSDSANSSVDDVLVEPPLSIPLFEWWCLNSKGDVLCSETIKHFLSLSFSIPWFSAHDVLRQFSLSSFSTSIMNPRNIIQYNFFPFAMRKSSPLDVKLFHIVEYSRAINFHSREIKNCSFTNRSWSLKAEFPLTINQAISVAWSLWGARPMFSCW